MSLTANPYANHPQLTPLEAEVLWEYAKLGDTIKKITALARDTAEKPNEPLLGDLRELEKKMKLVFTSYQTSVYRMNQDHFMAESEEQFQASEEVHDDYGHDQMEGDSTIRY